MLPDEKLVRNRVFRKHVLELNERYERSICGLKERKIFHVQRRSEEKVAQCKTGVLGWLSVMEIDTKRIQPRRA